MIFLKLDRSDEDEPFVFTVQAENLDALLDAEVEEYRKDDRLSPCFDLRTADCVSRDKNKILWAPGDGGVYTIAVYAADTPEGRKELADWE